MTTWPVHGRIDGPIVMIGFGSIGKGTLPLIERHFDYDKRRFTVIDPSDADRRLLDERGIRFVQVALTRENYREILMPLGMARSTLLVREADTSLLASPHVRTQSGEVVVSDPSFLERRHFRAQLLRDRDARGQVEIDGPVALGAEKFAPGGGVHARHGRATIRSACPLFRSDSAPRASRRLFGNRAMPSGARLHHDKGASS